MEITITDPNALELYNRFVCGKDCANATNEFDSVSFNIDNFQATDDPKERWRQLFACEALGDGNTTLSATEASVIDIAYLKSLPGYLKFAYQFSPAPDDSRANNIGDNTRLTFIEWFAGELDGNGAKEDFLDALYKYPRLAFLLDPDTPQTFQMLYSYFIEIGDDRDIRRKFLEIVGQYSDAMQFYEPLEYSQGFNREKFTTLVTSQLYLASWLSMREEPHYIELINDPAYHGELLEAQNPSVIGDVLKKKAELKIDKDIIIDWLSTTDDFGIYANALEALAIWGDEECVQILEDTIRFGGFQEHVMAGSAMREHLSIDVLQYSIDGLLYDEDPFVRAAGLRILQFLWQRDDFVDCVDYYLDEVKTIALNDSNPYVRMTAVQCLGYSNSDETLTFISSLKDDSAANQVMESSLENVLFNKKPSGFDNPIDYLSETYQYPIQCEWITNQLREMSANGEKPLRVLMLGCSYGTEALTLLMEIMKDYEANPEAWGDFNPQTDLRITVSDIEPLVLLYAQRGLYSADGPEHGDEFLYMQYYHDIYETDHDEQFNHFFEPTSSNDRYQYHLKPEYAQIIDTEYVDITKPPSEPVADIITYNKLDYHWSSHANATANFQQNCLRFTKKHAAYVTWNNPWFDVTAQMFTNPIHESGPFGFVEKKEEFFR
jgi:hypothetical protein